MAGVESSSSVGEGEALPLVERKQHAWVVASTSDGDYAVHPDEELEFEPLDSAEDAGTSSMPSAIFNLSNTIIGAGILSLPFAFKNTGVILGPAVLVFVGVLVIVSCRMLVTAAKYCGARSFPALALMCYGRSGLIATQASLVIACYGACASYLVIVGDMMSPLIGQWMGGSPEDFCSVYADRRFSISLSLLIVGPLSMARHIDSLKYTSYLALIMVLYLVVIVVVRSRESLLEGSGRRINFLGVSETLFRAVPIVTLAYTCQMNLFSLLTSLQNPTRKRVRRVVTSALMTCMSIYITVGLFGYLTFYDDTQGNVLLNYEVDDPFVMVGRLGVAIVILCSFPLMMHPCLDTLQMMIYPDQPTSQRRRFTFMFFAVGSAYAIAMLVSDVSVVLGIAGSTGSTAISFVLPPLFILKLSDAPLLSWQKACVSAISMLVLGVVFFVVSTVITLLDASKPKSEQDDLSNVCNETATRSS